MKKYKLKEYELYTDGSIEVDPSVVASMIMKGVPVANIFVTELNEEVELFNKFSQEKLKKKTELAPYSYNWTLPDQYKYMNVDDYLIDLSLLIEKDHLYEKRLQRLSKEIGLYKQFELEDLLKVLIYVVDTFKKENVVWGVGRGSSCSSYILFLMGLHDVDPVLYEIDIEDFLR